MCMGGIAALSSEASANGVDKRQAVDAAEAVPKQGKRPGGKHKSKYKAKRLPSGDLRYCLELKTREEIYLCVETERKP